MSTASFVRTNSPPTRRFASLAARRPMWLALTITAIITALRLTDTVATDIAWQLWIAQRIHAGAHLYRDIIEINPPLWFWMALPIDSLAELLHLPAQSVLIVAIGSLAALSLAATERLVRHVDPGSRSLLLALAALLFTAMPWIHVGQREQIVLIGTVPYAALIAARRGGKPVAPLLAILIGIGAGLGFALKHYFLIVPALLELWLVAGRARGWRPLRLEIMAMGMVGALYACALLLWARDFFSAAVPLARLAYGMFGPPSFRYMFGSAALVGLVMLGVVAAHRRHMAKGEAPLASALFVAAVGFALSYFIQFKGWPYHAIPFVGCASLALAALLTESKAPLRYLRLAAPALVLLPFYLAAEDRLHPTWPNRDLIDAVSGLQRGDSVGFLAAETAIPWSIVPEGGYRYASRYMGFWMMPAIARNEHFDRPDPRLTALGKQVVAETAADFACTPPKRIIVSRPSPRGDGFDILPMFLRDPRFAAILAHYKVRSRTSFETYELSSSLPRPAAGCRAGI